MAKPSELLECSWGRLRLFASQIHTDSGRTQVVHELSSGDDHPVQDRGLRVRRVRCQLQFDDFPGAPSPIDAVRALDAAKNTGQTAVFQHPLLGRFVASIGEFMQTIDDSSVISAECEFIKESEDQSVIPSGGGTSPGSGVSAVSAAAAQLDRDLSDKGMLKVSGPAAVSVMSRLPGGTSGITPSDVLGSIDLAASTSAALVDKIVASVKDNADSVAREIAAISSIPIVTEFGLSSAAASLRPLVLDTGDVALQVVRPISDALGDPSASLAAISTSEVSQGNFAMVTVDARVAVTGWAEGDVPNRRIAIDGARISNNIATMIEVGGFEDDLSLWPVYRSALMLGDSVRLAMASATSQAPSLFVMRIMEPTALLPLCARIYGGAAATERARQISEINDISTPGWLPPGDYRMPVRPSAAF